MSTPQHYRLVFPVIHFLDVPTTRAQASLAFSAGADGVFLISHNGQNALLPSVAIELKKLYPTKQVGINLLGVPALDALRVAKAACLDMVWTDNPGVSSAGLTEEATQIRKILKEGWQRCPQFFGSVAFKYQPYEPEPGRAAELAERLGMLPTTSGSATGQAPSLAKALEMSEAVGARNLAVASGMTPDNVEAYLPYFTHYLVATGVAKDMHHFDEDLLGQFIRKVHAFSQADAD